VSDQWGSIDISDSISFLFENNDLSCFRGFQSLSSFRLVSKNVEITLIKITILRVGIAQSI
jgi:hypothetical protein